MPFNAPVPKTTPREDLVGAYYEVPTDGDSGLRAREILPPRDVNKKFGTYGIIPVEGLMDVPNTLVGPRGVSAETEWSPESGNFALYEYRFKHKVVYSEADIYRDWFEAEEVGAQIVAGGIDRDYERIVSSILFNIATFPQDNVTGHGVSQPWDNDAGGLPITDTQNAVLRFEDKYFVTPNALILTHYAVRKLATNQQLMGRLRDHYGSDGIVEGQIPVEHLRKALSIERIIVVNSGMAKYNAAKPGQPKQIAKFWDEDFALFARIETNRNLNSPRLGHTLTLSGQEGVRIDSWDVKDPDGEYIRATDHRGHKLMHEPAGYLLSGLKT